MERQGAKSAQLKCWTRVANSQKTAVARLQSAGKRLGKYHAKPPCKQRTVEGVPLKSMCCRAGTGSSVLDPSPSVCGLSFVACSGPQMLHAPALWEQKEHLTSWRRRATHTHTQKDTVKLELSNLAWQSARFPARGAQIDVLKRAHIFTYIYYILPLSNTPSVTPYIY